MSSVTVQPKLWTRADYEKMIDVVCSDRTIV